MLITNSVDLYWPVHVNLVPTISQGHTDWAQYTWEPETIELLSKLFSKVPLDMAPRKHLTLVQKVEVIKMYEKGGKSQAALADEFGVGKTDECYLHSSA